jgi:hypothetical protein
VAEGDGEAVGDAGLAERVASLAGPVGSGVALRSVRSVRAGGGDSSGSVSTKESAIATTIAASVQTGASTTTSGATTHGRSQPPRTYHKSAANTTTTAAISHQGNPELSTPTPPPRGADNVSGAQASLRSWRNLTRCLRLGGNSTTNVR